MARSTQPSPRSTIDDVVEIGEVEPFSQVDDVFSRSMWDEAVATEEASRFFATYRRPLDTWRRAKGFTQRDYALRNASWHVADVFAEMFQDDDRRDGFLDPLSMLRDSATERVDLGDEVAAAGHVKHAAKLFGADDVGITENDPRWIYSDRFSATTGGPKPNDIGDGLDHVVVIAQRMDEGLIETAPSALAGAATGLGYSKDAAVLLGMAQFIRNLGYRAVPSMNDTALAIPLAISAGLGEYARNGLVIHPEFGPSFRIGKIFTDLPLAHDAPIDTGVARFCDSCTRCADACPASAIPHGRPTADPLNRSSIRGVTKWSVDGEACFGYWTKINSDCAVCIRVCPYTRGDGRQDRIWRRVAGSRARRLASRWHDRTDGGKRRRSDDWWGSAPTPVEISPKPQS